MNKKQLIAAWIIAIIIVILLGFKSVVCHDLLSPHLTSEYTLFWYGHILFGVMTQTKISFLFIVADNKFEIIAGLLIIGSLLVYTLKSKKQ